LDVASGPARDLKELFDQIAPNSLSVTCVEMDSRAIEFAKNLNVNHLEHMEFINQNIFKFRTEAKYDVVWSAGLFDYFDDKSFVLILKKLMDFATEKGEIIIGNFNDENPSRDYMEMVGDWMLNHRSEEQLINLAIQAGADPAKIWVGQEPEGINLFLHIWK
jgi:SAM-dependent methyltransferase